MTSVPIPTAVLKTVEKKKDIVKRDGVGEKERDVYTSEGSRKTVTPLTLYDFYFSPFGVEVGSTKSNSSAYINVISDTVELESKIKDESIALSLELIALDPYSNATSQINNESFFESSESENIPEEDTLPDLQGSPLRIELSDSDESMTAEAPEADINPTAIPSSEEIVEVSLCSGRVLPPRGDVNEKGKKIIEDLSSSLMNSPPTQGFENPASSAPKVEYNVLSHLRKLLTKSSIYDALVLSKEMRESLIQALLDPEICLAQLASTSQDEACCSKS